jgi:hypothetical protein
MHDSSCYVLLQWWFACSNESEPIQFPADNISYEDYIVIEILAKITCIFRCACKQYKKQRI